MKIDIVTDSFNKEQFFMKFYEDVELYDDHIIIDKETYKINHLNDGIISYSYKDSINYIRHLKDNMYYTSDEFGNLISPRSRLCCGSDTEWAVRIDNDIYILNHRCASSSLRRLCSYKRGEIRKDQIYNPILHFHCWGTKYDHIKDLMNLSNKQNYTYHMIIHPDYQTMTVKKITPWLNLNNIEKEFESFLLVLRYSNYNINTNYLSNVHYISQMSQLNILGVPKENLKLYMFDKLDLLAQKEFGVDKFPVLHKNYVSKIKLFDIANVYKNEINEIFKGDDPLYGTEFKNNYVEE